MERDKLIGTKFKADLLSSERLRLVSPINTSLKRLVLKLDHYLILINKDFLMFLWEDFATAIPQLEPMLLDHKTMITLPSSWSL